MSIKDLFNNPGTPKIQKSVTSDELVANVESSDYVEAKRTQFDQVIPPIDFSDPSNFAKFGSAELYYEKAFERIHNHYPYDGTLTEKVEFENSSSYLDKYVFDNLYPRTNGYLTFNNSNQHIDVFGGPHTASSGMIGNTFDSTFDLSMKYDEQKKRTSAFEYRGDDGITFEFWLKPDSISGAPNQRAIAHISGANGFILLQQVDDDLTLIVQSGSTYNPSNYASFNIPAFLETEWGHYAVSLLSSSSGLEVKSYKNGQLQNQNTLSRDIPNILPTSDCLNMRIGNDFDSFRPFEGSIDEFRFWKKARTPEQIFNNWFVPIGGGTNKKDANLDLGLYLKFNEGITGNSALDSIVLDYSGRINNGAISNYTESMRNTGSAITEKLGEPEWQDPIIYSSHPDVISKKAEYKTSGSLADNESTSMVFSYFPGWMQEEDEQSGNQLKHLSQVLGSYFDTLWHQINFVNRIHDDHYISGSNSSLPFAKKLLYNRGFVMPDLFADATVTEALMGKDDNEVYEKEINEVRNTIYHNIYSNLDTIYKSKGTEKAFRNFFRSLGIGDELVKLRMYADDSTFVLRDNYELKSFERKFLNFNYDGHFDATLYQTSSVSNSNIYIPGDTSYSGSFTAETEIVLPRKNKINERGYVPFNHLTASVFGFHSGSEYTHPGTDYDLSVYVLKENTDSQLNPDDSHRVRFMVTGAFGEVTSSLFSYQYENNKWNLAVKLRHENYPLANVTGNVPNNYVLEFYGVEADGYTKRNSFYVTSSISADYFTSDKIFYAGAHRTNFTGSTVHTTDIKLGFLRYWHSFLSNEAIDQHAYDPETFGANEPFENDLVNTYSVEIPREKTLALHWAFGNLTGSDSSGELLVSDLSSGSSDSNYGPLSDTIQRYVQGKAEGFNASSQNALDKLYLQTARKRLPDDLMSSDLTTIKSDETEQFFIDDDVSDNFYSFEKSMWGTISDEMMSMFSTALDLNNLIGQPNQKYHHKYNMADFLRDRFFDDVENEPDIEKFTSFYKWIDDSISIAIQQLVPASARFSEKINNVIESHVLERNKYVHQVPMLTTFESTEGSIKGISEMKYNWQFGHGVEPLTATATIVVDDVDLTSDGDTFTLVDSSGLSTVYTIDSTKLRQQGGGSGGSAIVGFFGIGPGYDTTAALHIEFAINNTTDANYTAVRDGTTITITQGTAGSLGNRVNPSSIPGVSVSNFTGGDDREYEHTLWHDERSQKEGLREILRTSRNNHSIQSSGLVRREIDGTARVSDVYAVRKFAKLHDFGIVSQNTIHGGTNFGRKKNLHLFHESIAPNGALGSVSLVPQNVITVGVGVGQGIVEKAISIDAPPRKKKYQTEAQIGNRFGDEYGHNVHGDFVLPLNIMSGTVNSGFNTVVESLYRSGTHIANLHNDVVGNSNEVSIQGPFTEQHVGGLQYRHIDLNHGGDTEENRAEGWGLSIAEHPVDPSADGALGFLGADYENPYPGTTPKATRYRDEHAKRPINARNIKTVSGSWKAGNYTNEIQLFQLDAASQRYWAREAEADDTVDILPQRFTASLPATTHYQSLFGAIPGEDGNVFGGPNNRQEPISSSLSPTGTPHLAVYAPSTNTISRAYLQDNAASGYSTTGYKSISFWYKQPATLVPSSGNNYIADLQNSINTRAIQIHFKDETNELIFNFSHSGGTATVKYDISSFRESWANYVLVWSGVFNSEPQLYINGNAVTASEAWDGSGTNPLNLIEKITLFDLNGGTTDNEAQAAMSHFGIWEGDLTNYVQDIYNQGAVREEPVLQGDLVDFWYLGKNKTGFSSGDTVPAGTVFYSFFPAGNHLIQHPNTTAFQFIDGPPTLETVEDQRESNEIASPRTDLTGSERIINTRFSAPGGPEIQSIGYLDAYSSTYSAHNALPFRNLSVLGSGSGEAGTIRVEDHLGLRRGLKTLRALHQGKFGIDSQYGVVSETSYPSSGSFNKQHRNTSKVISPDFAFDASIRFPKTATGPQIGLMSPDNSYDAATFPPTGGKSFSFWVNFDDPESMNQANAFSAFNALGDVSIEAFFQPGKLYFRAYRSTGNTDYKYWGINYDWKQSVWYHIFIRWDGTFANDPHFVINGVSVNKDFQLGSATGTSILQVKKIVLGDSEVNSINGELQGRLSHFVAYKNNGDHGRTLYNSGVPLVTGLPDSSNIIDFWLLGNEEELSDRRVLGLGTKIYPKILTSVSGNNTTVQAASTDLATLEKGIVYGSEILISQEKHDNSFINTPIPRSEFQYSWIKSSISGSNWEDNQVILGYAPRDGFARGGNNVVSAIVFPTASTIYSDY